MHAPNRIDYLHRYLLKLGEVIGEVVWVSSGQRAMNRVLGLFTLIIIIHRNVLQKTARCGILML